MGKLVKSRQRLHYREKSTNPSVASTETSPRPLFHLISISNSTCFHSLFSTQIHKAVKSDFGTSRETLFAVKASREALLKRFFNNADTPRLENLPQQNPPIVLMRFKPCNCEKVHYTQPTIINYWVEYVERPKSTSGRSCVITASAARVDDLL